MIKLDDIKDEVFVAYRKAQLKAMDTDRKGQLHVSDVISPCIIYIDSKNSQRFEKPILKPFRLKPIEDALENIRTNGKILKESILKDKKPERTICYLCSGMCPYAEKCMREET